MLDYSHLIDNPNVNTQVFSGGLSSSLRYVTWSKPRGVAWIYMLVIGGGGAGGGSANSVSASFGGGGGGSGAMTSLMIPAMYVPDVLYVSAANMAQPTTIGTTGSAGVASIIMSEPPVTGQLAPGQLIFLNANGGGGGGGGNNISGGTAGAAGTTTALSGQQLASKGRYLAQTGNAGVNGVSTSVGYGLANPTQGGGGGGKAGAAPVAPAVLNPPTGLLGQEMFPSLFNNSLDSNGSGGAGQLPKNFLVFTPGIGGIGTNTTTVTPATWGGNGGIGCGGGGAGGADVSLGQVNPRGGFGGPGLVLIASW